MNYQRLMSGIGVTSLGLLLAVAAGFATGRTSPTDTLVRALAIFVLAFVAVRTLKALDVRLSKSVMRTSPSPLRSEQASDEQ